MMTSSGVIMPRSPWLASAGWTKNEGLPVDANVAAILWPTWPDLPIPLTTTRPRAPRISSIAAAKGCPRPFCMAAASAEMPLPPASRVRKAESISDRLGLLELASKGFPGGEVAQDSADSPNSTKNGPGRPPGSLRQPPVNHSHFIPVNECVPFGRPLRTSPVPRLFVALTAAASGAVLFMAAPAPACAQAPAFAQAPDQPNGWRPLDPASVFRPLEGDPRNPGRFRRAAALRQDGPSRFGDIPVYGNPPASGAGSRGLDST